MVYILGHFRFMAVLLASIIGGGLMCTYFGRQDTTTVGISGGLYGLLIRPLQHRIVPRDC